MKFSTIILSAAISLSLGIGPSIAQSGNWNVTGVAQNDVLNVRAGPGTENRIVGALANGDTVENLGCLQHGQSRWCHIRMLDDMRSEGWVNARFLRQATETSANSPNYDRPIGGVMPKGSSFTATGLITCNRDRDSADATCEIGVVREGGGNGWVAVFWPDGGARVINFESGTPVSFVSSEADRGIEMQVSREGDTHTVFIGDSRIVIPDAVINGG